MIYFELMDYSGSWVERLFWGGILARSGLLIFKDKMSDSVTLIEGNLKKKGNGQLEMLTWRNNFLIQLTKVTQTGNLKSIT